MLFVKYNSGMPTQEVFTICVSAALSGYFALRYDEDGESCFANDDSNALAFDGLDVGERWRTIFEALFYTNVGMLIVVTLSYMMSDSSFRHNLYQLISVGRTINGCVWLFALYTRVAHSGRVCAGDFLDIDAFSYEPQSGYLIQQGLYLKCMLVLAAFSICLALTCGLFAAIFGRDRSGEL